MSTKFQEGPAANLPTATWLNAVDDMLTAGGNTGSAVTFAGAGPTSSRPIAPKLYSLYIDTTLQQPLFCTQITPTVVWINAAGVSV